MVRPIPSISGFTNRPVISLYAAGLRCCWDLENEGGRVADVVEWMRNNRPHEDTRVTAVIRTKHSTWVVDVCEENVRVTHFRHYDLWLSARMRLWWKERKEKMQGEVA